ncbi:MAG: site-specific DNA-methyltransferase [Nanopusillaceae archaeon]
MERLNDSKKRFYDALKDLFIGAKIEGESGYINLMKIKAKYFDIVFSQLKKEIDEKIKEFPEFEEELYDKLYSFFKRYFSESGSIFFVSTPFSERIYERIYIDREDVVLFWKTHMLYYVKTDRLFRSMKIELNGFRFYFDVSRLEHKKAWEKREIIYELKDVESDGTISFYVFYSERRRKTNIESIIKELRKRGINIDKEVLKKAFKIFEKQSEVDYFINKNARQFLKEQFDLWFYQYIYSNEIDLSERRIRQLKLLKEIAYKIIDFISQFEEELVKIWNKPKFILNSNYVITLDRIAKKGEKGIRLIEKIINHPGFEDQVKEWKELGIVENFDKNKLFIRTLNGKSLNKDYQFLPIDTRYFDEEIKYELLSLFDNLDKEIDGWLIKSENYQALITILPKFKEKVQTIYIDPPFNKEQDADYFYSVKFKDAIWATMLENRLRIAREFLKDTGCIFVRCDYNGNWIVRAIMDEIFGKENFRNEIIVKRGSHKAELFKQFEKLKSLGVAYDNLYFYSKNPETKWKPFTKILKERKKGHWANFYKSGLFYDRPTMRYELLGIKLEKGQWLWSKERALKAVENYMKYLEECKKNPMSLEEYWEKTGRKLEFVRRNGNKIEYWIPPKDMEILDNNWLDIPGYSHNWGFATENSEILLKRVIECSSNEGDIIMDFFLGSGTTTAVAHKLKRKWIGIEMGEHFYTVVLPRMKEVLAGKGNHEPCGISKEVKWQGGGFFKYFEVEQFEQTLRKVKYDCNDPFLMPGEDPYNQYIFMRDKKLLEALEIDYKENKIKVNLSKLYDNIDIAETLSCLLGKMIKRISKDMVEFEDGTIIDLKNLDYKLIKPLIWW